MVQGLQALGLCPMALLQGARVRDNNHIKLQSTTALRTYMPPREGLASKEHNTKTFTGLTSAF